MQTLRISFFPDNVCDQHGVWDVLPCPWPGCKNGLEEDQFKAEVSAEGQQPETFTRRAWRSPLGDDYYTWDGDKLPNWFSAPKTFWNEARRHRLLPTTAPDLVYHYTSLEGFVGIIQSRSLWLSDYSYLNDRRELTHGVDVVCEVADEMLRTHPESAVGELLLAWKRNLSATTHRVCIVSFSADEDSLSQWRAYGPIAIGIEPRHLPIHAYQTRLGAVEYDREIQRKLASIYLSHLTQAYQVDLKEGQLEYTPDVYHGTERIIELVAFFKDAAFRSEHEYRLVYIEDTATSRSFNLPSPPKNFRVARTRLVPYVASDELSPFKNKRSPLDVKEVVLGPEADDLLERGVRELLASSALPDVKVRRSRVPYRT